VFTVIVIVTESKSDSWPLPCLAAPEKEFRSLTPLPYRFEDISRRAVARRFRFADYASLVKRAM
jgi:hypothetical protein